MKINVLIIISLDVISKSVISNKPALVQIMPWHQTCDKP